MAGDEARVLLGTNRVAVRCLEVGAGKVVMERLDGGMRVELQLKPSESGSD